MTDVAVIGSGPNGLVAAARLARAGMRVDVFEAHPSRAGGAVGSVESTLPGFVHDVGAGFFAFRDSEALRELDLGRHGLRWAHTPIQSCHPAPDGTVACISRADGEDARFGDEADTHTWRRIVAWHRKVDAFLVSQLGPLPQLRPMLSVNPLDLARLGFLLAHSSASLSTRWFGSEAARRVLPGMGMHVDAPPDARFGAQLGYALALRATTNGFSVPVGGARSVAAALLAEVEAAGGHVHLGRPVERIEIRDGAAVAIHAGDEVRVRHGVIADTSAPALLLRLVDPKHVPRRLVRAMRSFDWGWGTFKVDYALDGPVPWTVPECHRAGVVHAGDDLTDLRRFAHEIGAGELPGHPYLVIGQQSLCDPSRAPEGQHTLYVYTHVPVRLRDPKPWTELAECFADTITARIEELAPGFASHVLARAIHTPEDLERSNDNLVGGNLGGGANGWQRQLIFRPLFPWFRHRLGIKRLYLGSSYAHPGAGVHGMGGWNAAAMLLRDAPA